MSARGRGGLRTSPYGVLGTQMAAGGVRKVAMEPAPGLPIVDPAGLPYIRNGPQGAGGAAGQIYRWLGISQDEAFPAPVREAIEVPLQAKLHFYGPKGCIHVVGPNFHGRTCTREEAVEELSEAYRAVFGELAVSRLGGLRMLPVSGGIFAGPFASELPELTRDALYRGWRALPPAEQHVVSVARLDMCIFMEEEFEAFAAAFADDVSSKL